MSSGNYGKQAIHITTVSSRTRQPFSPHYSASGVSFASRNPYAVGSSRELVKELGGETQSAPANPHLADDVDNKENQSSSEGVPEIVVSEELPLSRLNFFGILISGLIIIVSIGYIVISVVFHFDKRGKEAYYTNDPNTEVTLSHVFTYPPTDGVGVKTDYWGWFERSHDEDSELKTYDVYYSTLITGVVGGTFWVVLGIFEILKYKNNRVGKAVAVRSGVM